MIKKIIKIAAMAGNVIMSFYRGNQVEISLMKKKSTFTEADCSLVTYSDRITLIYNKVKLSNPLFIASRKGFNWQ